ncbi:hypothetical protein RDABS01_001519 [Bienertia sinuspersici]
MIRNRLEWLNIMVTEPYYFLHFLIFFSYLPLRISASSFFLHDFSLPPSSTFLAFSIFATVKMVREETWEGFIADTSLYGKAFIFLLALYVDYTWPYVLYVIAQQPAFPELGAVNTMTPLQLETTLIEGTRLDTGWLSFVLYARQLVYETVGIFLNFLSHMQISTCLLLWLILDFSLTLLKNLEFPLQEKWDFQHTYYLRTTLR